jgi:hypothetical protein
MVSKKSSDHIHPSSRDSRLTLLFLVLESP